MTAQIDMYQTDSPVWHMSNWQSRSKHVKEAAQVDMCRSYGSSWHTLNWEPSLRYVKQVVLSIHVKVTHVWHMSNWQFVLDTCQKAAQDDICQSDSTIWPISNGQSSLTHVGQSRLTVINVTVVQSCAVNNLTATVLPFLPQPPVNMTEMLACASVPAISTATPMGTSFSSTPPAEAPPPASYTTGDTTSQHPFSHNIWHTTC